MWSNFLEQILDCIDYKIYSTILQLPLKTTVLSALNCCIGLCLMGSWYRLIASSLLETLKASTLLTLFGQISHSMHCSCLCCNIKHCAALLSAVQLPTCPGVCDCVAHGARSKHVGQEAGTLGVSMLRSGIWNDSPPITNSSF